MARDIAGKKKPLNHPLAFLQNQKWNNFQSISGTSSAKRLVIKPIYRHSPCDRRGRGRTKKRRRGPALRTVFLLLLFYVFFFANRSPFPHLSDNVNRQYATNFRLNLLSFFSFLPYRSFQHPSRRQNCCKATATVFFRSLRSFQVYIGIFPY